MKRRTEYFWAAGIAAGSLALLAAAAVSPFVSRILRACGRTLARAISRVLWYLPVSLAEILILLGPIALIVVIVILARRKKLRAALPKFAQALALLLLLSVLMCFVHYTAPPLAEELGLAVSETYTQAEVYDTAVWFAESCNALQRELVRSENGELILNLSFLPRSNTDLIPGLEEGFSRLAESCSRFSGRMPSPRRGVVLSHFMSYFGIAGIYIPFTGETIYNYNSPRANIPFNMAHEMAHAYGVAHEDEANFIGFLACFRSTCPEARYSGLYTALIYLLNELDSGEQRNAIYDMLDQAVLDDLERGREYSASWAGPARDFGESVNNAYLIASGQPEGVESYDGVVRLLIAWCAQQR